MKKGIMTLLLTLALVFGVFAAPASAVTKTYDLNGTSCFWGGNAAIKITNNTGQSWSYYVYQDYGSVWWGPQGTWYGYAGRIHAGQTHYFVYSGYTESYSRVLPPGMGNFQRARISFVNYNVGSASNWAFTVSEICY